MNQNVFCFWSQKYPIWLRSECTCIYNFPFQDIQTTLDVGREKLDDTLSRGELVKNETSKQGQDLIREELTMLTNDFEQFDTDINELQNNLGKCTIFVLMYAFSLINAPFHTS